jgi:hypothetical protein
MADLIWDEASPEPWTSFKKRLAWSWEKFVRDNGCTKGPPVRIDPARHDLAGVRHGFDSANLSPS